MIQVQVRKVIHARKWKVLRMITRPQEFPHFMPNVKQCTVLEKNKKTAVSSWYIEIDGLGLRWEQEDVINTSDFTVSFRATEGDLSHYDGSWHLNDLPGAGTEVLVEVNAAIGIPKFETIVEGVLAEKIKKNVEAMLDCIAERLLSRRYQMIQNRKVSDVRGFAVIGHPYNLEHLIRYFRYHNPDFKIPSEEFLRSLFDATPSHPAEALTIRSKTGREAKGYFVVCPIIPDSLILNPQMVLRKVVEACKVSEDLGLGIATLGGFTSIAGERFSDDLMKAIHMPITTGNTFTVAMAVAGVRKAASLMRLDLEEAKVTVIGGTGDIGSACARILCRDVAEITITSRTERNFSHIKKVLSRAGKAKIKTSCDNNGAVRHADIVIAAASSNRSIVESKYFKPGAIVCDVGYPKNISSAVGERKDILIFSGGICSLPCSFKVGFDLGLPSKLVLYGCFAEAMILDLEERYENFSWGRGNITPEKVDEILEMGKKHGFEQSPFFAGNKIMSDEEVAAIAKSRAGR